MISFFRSLFQSREIIWTLAKNDISSRYMGSALGVFWIFVLPLVNLGIIWFAFEQGLKAGPLAGAPFILWLISGMFPWIFFSDSISSAANSIIEKPFLVKKIIFNVELLPLVKIVSSSILFLFLSLVMLLVFVAYGLFPSIYWLQIPYYVLCLFALVMAFSWFTSAVVIFYRDLGQIIAIVIQIGFWATPIFWSPEILPEKFKFVTFFNPMSYIISGYRHSLIQNIWFWETPTQTAYFWILIFLFFNVGLRIFRKLRPHFADVL